MTPSCQVEKSGSDEAIADPRVSSDGLQGEVDAELGLGPLLHFAK